ncbi:MAG TPA: class I lanthipeptide [Polyangia bacterium]|nr:class I lanthipeptide [Polyangia bacterium]
MKKAKKLTLQKKTIRELSNNELGTVAGGMTMLTKCIDTASVPRSCGSSPSTNCGDTSFVICG